MNCKYRAMWITSNHWNKIPDGCVTRGICEYMQSDAFLWWCRYVTLEWYPVRISILSIKKKERLLHDLELSTRPIRVANSFRGTEMARKTCRPKFPTISKQILKVVSKLFRTAETKHASTKKTIWETPYVFGNIRSLADPVERTRTEHPDKWTSIC